MTEPKQHWIGPYRLLRPLGQGGMGAVYLAERGPKHYALKVLLDKAQDSVQRFEREAEALVALDQNANIVRVHDFAKTPYPYLVMSWVPGPDLHVWRENNPISEQEALRITDAIAHGLEAIHRRGLIHRDLKPHNVIYADERPVIIDFGLAGGESFETLTQTQERLGTPKTMAPEQWRLRSADWDQGVDIWALGVIHFYLVTGEYPFRSNLPVELAKEVQTPESHVSYSILPEHSRKILERVFVVNPKKRLRSVAEYRELIKNEPADAKPSTLRVWLPAIFALFIMFIGLGFWFEVSNVQQRELKGRVESNVIKLQQKILEFAPSLVQRAILEDPHWTEKSLNCDPIIESIDQIVQQLRLVKADSKTKAFARELVAAKAEFKKGTLNCVAVLDGLKRCDAALKFLRPNQDLGPKFKSLQTEAQFWQKLLNLYNSGEFDSVLHTLRATAKTRDRDLEAVVFARWLLTEFQDANRGLYRAVKSMKSVDYELWHREWTLRIDQVVAQLKRSQYESSYRMYRAVGFAEKWPAPKLPYEFMNNIHQTIFTTNAKSPDFHEMILLQSLMRIQHKKAAQKGLREHEFISAVQQTISLEGKKVKGKTVIQKFSKSQVMTYLYVMKAKLFSRLAHELVLKTLTLRDLSIEADLPWQKVLLRFLFRAKAVLVTVNSVGTKLLPTDTEAVDFYFEQSYELENCNNSVVNSDCYIMFRRRQILAFANIFNAAGSMYRRGLDKKEVLIRWPDTPKHVRRVIQYWQRNFKELGFLPNTVLQIGGILRSIARMYIPNFDVDSIPDKY